MGAQAAVKVPQFEDDDVAFAPQHPLNDPRFERMVLQSMCAPSLPEDRIKTTRGQLFAIVGIAAAGWAAVFGVGAMLFA